MDQYTHTDAINVIIDPEGVGAIAGSLQIVATVNKAESFPGLCGKTSSIGGTSASMIEGPGPGPLLGIGSSLISLGCK